MNGKGQVRFSELFADTIKTHGMVFGFEYYVNKHGMQTWEFGLWFYIVYGRKFEGIEYYFH